MMKKQPASRTCFMCGRQNDMGLKMEWFNDIEAGQVIGTVTIAEHFNGYPGIVHGGIIAAILDETAGRAVMLQGDFENLFVTVHLAINYRHPTPTRTPLTAVGWLQHRSGTKAKVAAELRLPDGTVTAECEAIVVRPPDKISQLWEPEKPYWKVYE